MSLGMPGRLGPLLFIFNFYKMPYIVIIEKPGVLKLCFITIKLTKPSGFGRSYSLTRVFFLGICFSLDLHLFLPCGMDRFDSAQDWKKFQDTFINCLAGSFPRKAGCTYLL